MVGSKSYKNMSEMSPTHNMVNPFYVMYSMLCMLGCIMSYCQYKCNACWNALVF